VLDVEGGDVLLAPTDMAGASMLEQIAAVEARIDTLNTAITLRGGFAETPVRRLPPAAVREAILNAVAHRDWMPPDPISITFVEADSALQVVSPGGFVGGVDANNVLTERYARYPALADLLRALTLVEKQGLGVDRMYREMIWLGHRPPALIEEAGPRVRVRLVGGKPIVPVMNLVSGIQPSVRQRDVRVALVVWTLLHRPFVVPGQLVGVLQRPVAEVIEALEATAECHIGDQPLLTRYKDVWMLSSAALRVVGTGSGRIALRRRGVLTYRHPDSGEDVTRRWLAVHDRYTSGDHATLTGLSHAGALNQLTRLEEEGIVVRGVTSGRNAHFVAGPAMDATPDHTR
jgi:ATP-dependent DNA helicase RecG